MFLEGEDSRGDHGLGRLVEFRFKAPPGTTSSSVTIHTSSGQRNCASLASQPQKSVTLLPCPGGRTTKSTEHMWWHWGEILSYIMLCKLEAKKKTEISFGYWDTKTREKVLIPLLEVARSFYGVIYHS